MEVSIGTVVKGDLLKRLRVELGCEGFGSVERNEEEIRRTGGRDECGKVLKL